MKNKKDNSSNAVSPDEMNKLVKELESLNQQHNQGIQQTQEEKVGFFKRIKNLIADYRYITNKKDKDLYLIEDSISDAAEFGLIDDTKASRANRIIMAIFIFLFIMVIWAYFAEVAEVTKGNGKIIPSSKEQLIQSLDGGIVTNIFVREGDIVQVGQTLATLDSTRTASSLEESQAKYNTALATSIRLKAEVEQHKIVNLVFPEELQTQTELINYENKLYLSRKQKLTQTLANLQKSKHIIRQQLNINKELARQGASSTVEVLRLEKELIDLESKTQEYTSDFYVTARQELAKVMAEIDSLAPLIKGRQDFVQKTTITSPVKGIVKNIQNSTIGGVVPPNGILMDIVPLEDTLIIEAKISPKDIAFIHPGQEAKVKITAYDYAIYGGLEGTVSVISPDTVKDEVKSDVTYYKIYIKTDKDYLVNKAGKSFSITPGMIASVEITTGSKTVLQYLIKPFNKINEALRER
ncbi:HlyD family type I secretion periplasmic adaptor subunit [Proteus vulgaris]|nr:HlyD family type I secretion periplasmic adaptor subunit [Proteus vulgaris]MDS0787270.1 HlyD family type I secretion periplasmic adaptor subunit [Proteus vulgaris]